MTDLALQSTDTLASPPSLGAGLKSEVLNVRSTSTVRWLLIASVVMAAASAIANLATVDEAELAKVDTIELAMHASTVATLVFALVAGIVSATSDFRFGRIDQLLLSQPKRSRLFATKAAVGAGIGLLYGLIGAVAAVVCTSGYLSYKDVTVDMTSAPVLRPLLGVVIGATLFAVIGIGVGTAVRNQPAALAGSLAFMLIVEPTALVGLPSVAKWLPGASGLALTVAPDPNLLPQFAAAALLIAWTALALAIGNHRLKNANI